MTALRLGAHDEYQLGFGAHDEYQLGLGAHDEYQLGLAEQPTDASGYLSRVGPSGGGALSADNSNTDPQDVKCGRLVLAVEALGRRVV